MNNDILSGNWKQLAGKVKQQWGKLTDDDITKINGRQEELLGRIQERYGYNKEAAEKAIDEFYKKCHSDK
jgi:uncharacterized protein YjbJ (UPF0337 family)